METARQPSFPDGGGDRRDFRRQAGSNRGFTLIEMLVSMTVLVLLMVILVQIFSGVSSAWTSNTGRSGAFAAARSAFEAMGRNLSQATLNTYLGYADAQGLPVPLINPSFNFKATASPDQRGKVPVQYLRASELHFVTDQTSEIFKPSMANVMGLMTTGQAVFFQATTGFAANVDNQPKQSLLNVLGYYLEFCKDDAFKGTVTAGRSQSLYRYRLMEVIQPAETNGIYHSTGETDSATGLPKYNYDLNWISNLGLSGNSSALKHPLAENIIALALWPKLSPLQNGAYTSLTKDFSYDSRRWEDSTRASSADKRWRNQLPPIITLTLVAVDEPSAIKMAQRFGGDGTQPPLTNATLREQFQIETLFQDPDKLAEDLKKLSSGLDNLRINYRVFQADINMHGSQWSNQ